MTNNKGMIKFVITIVFSSSKCTKICFPPLGKLTTLPRLPIRLGRGIPSPHYPPHSSQAPLHKILATPVNGIYAIKIVLL